MVTIRTKIQPCVKMGIENVQKVNFSVVIKSAYLHAGGVTMMMIVMMVRMRKIVANIDVKKISLNAQVDTVFHLNWYAMVKKTVKMFLMK